MVVHETMGCHYTAVRRVALISAGTLLLLGLFVVHLFPGCLQVVEDLRRPFRSRLTDIQRARLWQTIDTVTASLEVYATVLLTAK